MKLTIALLLMCCAANAQTRYEAFSLTTKIWDSFHEEWIATKQADVNIALTFDQKTMFINDNNRSRFYLGAYHKEVLENGGIFIRIPARDEEGKACFVTLVTQPGSDQTIIATIYDNVMWEYKTF